MVPYYKSSICHCHHFEHLFLLDQINFNVYILMLTLGPFPCQLSPGGDVFSDSGRGSKPAGLIN